MAELIKHIRLNGTDYDFPAGGGGAVKKAKFNNNGSINWIDEPPHSFQEDPQLFFIERADGAMHRAADLTSIWCQCGNAPIATWPLDCDMWAWVSKEDYIDVITIPTHNTDYFGSAIPEVSDIVKYLRSRGPVTAILPMPSYTDYVRCYDEDNTLIAHEDQGFIYLYANGEFAVYYGSDPYKYENVNKIEIDNNITINATGLSRVRLDASICIKSRTGYSDTFNEYSMLTCTECSSSGNTFVPVSPNRLQTGICLIIGKWYTF